MLPVFRIDLHYPIYIRDRDSQLPSRFENLTPTTQNEQDFGVGKVLQDVASIDYGRTSFSTTSQFPHIIQNVHGWEAEININIQKSGDVNGATPQMQLQVMARYRKADSKGEA